MSGPIEVAKHCCREICYKEGLCVTVEPTVFIYTGGEEVGFVIGLLNYPRFPCSEEQLNLTADLLVESLLNATFQHSALIVTGNNTRWITRREQ
jgi:hypothetical protein